MQRKKAYTAWNSGHKPKRIEKMRRQNQVWGAINKYPLTHIDIYWTIVSMQHEVTHAMHPDIDKLCVS